MPRYYFGENAARPIIAGGQKFTFTITGMVAGAVQGIVAVPDDLHPVFLSVAARYGVQEITSEAYAAALAKKKKIPRLTVSVDLTPPSSRAPAPSSPPVVAVKVEDYRAVPDPRPAPTGLPPIKGDRPAAVVPGESLTKTEARDHLPSTLDEAVDLGTAVPPVVEVPVKKTTRRLNQAAKRGFAL